MKMRDYQANIKEKLESHEFRRFLLAWPRRSGKDKFALQLCLDLCHEKKSVVYYVFPTWRIARCIMSGWNLESTKEYIIHPKMMSIEFYNGSSIKFIGNSDYKSLEFTHPDLCIFSEYSMIDPLLSSRVYENCVANDGDAIFIGTPFPREGDPMRVLYNKVKDDEKWYVEALTIDSTKHMSENYIKDEIDDGLMSDEAKQKDFYPSF